MVASFDSPAQERSISPVRRSRNAARLLAPLSYPSCCLYSRTLEGSERINLLAVMRIQSAPAPAGPFNVSSHTTLTLGINTTIRASNISGPDWPLLTVFDIWPWFGQGRDAPPGTEAARLMHNPIIFAWHATNISIIAQEGGTLDGQGSIMRQLHRTAPCKPRATCAQRAAGSALFR